MGSDLFDQITRLPEYYPTRAEAEILRARSAEIASVAGADTLVELGSGTSEKTRTLLAALHDGGTLRRFVPFDVDASVLSAAGRPSSASIPISKSRLSAAISKSTCRKFPDGGRRLFVFLGSTIGNLTAEPRAEFLAALAGVMRPDDSLLLGTDLVKDVGRLVQPMTTRQE